VISDRRLLACAVLSVAGHLAFARGLQRLPRHDTTHTKRVVSIRVVPAPPALEPPPEPAAAPAPVPKTVPHERPRARPVPAAAHDLVPKDVPPPDRPAAPGDSTTPVFGVSLESTSQAGGGPAMPIGNTGHATGPSEPGSGPAKPLAEPVAAYEVTTMPLPQGRCLGKYTEEARQAGTEGTVVLDLIVDANGRARDVRVVTGLPHGLTEAAVAALKECRFSPGEKDGAAVPVRIRGFKIRFLLQNDE